MTEHVAGYTTYFLFNCKTLLSFSKKIHKLPDLRNIEIAQGAASVSNPYPGYQFQASFLILVSHYSSNQRFTISFLLYNELLTYSDLNHEIFSFSLSLGDEKLVKLLIPIGPLTHGKPHFDQQRAIRLKYIQDPHESTQLDQQQF